MVKYILMPEKTIQKIRKGDKFFVNGEFNPNAARLITAAHDAYFWVDDRGMPHWTVDAEEGGCYGYGEICQQVELFRYSQKLAVFFYENGELAY